MNTFVDAYDEKVRPLMDKIDQVRSLLSSNEDGVVLPNVVVVGDQSSGKSTLLEALSLVELPKGSGIVTRCPLVLRLRRAMKRTIYRIHGKDKQLLDEATLDVMKYIEEETQKLAGTQKNVVHDLIELQIEDPNVRDLTVVDLPGIARIPIADQPKNIYKQTTDLIRKFIRQEGSVILCVFPANVDVVTVESFNIAREFDPEGVRTIGVITKSDLAPREDALIQQLLMDQSDVLKLKLGFVAVRNRSSDEKITLEDARQREKEFFRQGSIATITGWDCLGVEALINRLADLYADRVRETFPRMKADVQARLKDITEQLAKLPPNLETPTARLAKYHELADAYVENIVRVRFTSSSDGQHVSIVNTLHSRFTRYHEIVRQQTKEFYTQNYREEVAKGMATCVGEQLPNFLPHPVLKRLVSEKLEQLWRTTEMLINESFQTSLHALTNKDQEACQDNLLLIKLLPVFRESAVTFLQKKKSSTYDQLEEMIRIEKQEPYTLNHSYMDTINEYKQFLAQIEDANAARTTPKPPALDDDDCKMFRAISTDEQSVQDMVISIYAYWKLLTKRFMDYAALSLRSGCVFDVCPGVRHRLTQIPTEMPEFVDAQLSEDVSIRSRRRHLQQTKERLAKVNAILGGGTAFGHERDTVGISSIGTSSNTTLEMLAASLSTNNLVGDTDRPPLERAAPPQTPVLTTTTTATAPVNNANVILAKKK